jgi:hypothetical protein
VSPVHHQSVRPSAPRRPQVFLRRLCVPLDSGDAAEPVVRLGSQWGRQAACVPRQPPPM